MEPNSHRLALYRDARATLVEALRELQPSDLVVDALKKTLRLRAEIVALRSRILAEQGDHVAARTEKTIAERLTQVADGLTTDQLTPSLATTLAGLLPPDP